MVDFAGWEMPLMYRGILEEHHHTRSACSVFDVSHMGRLKLTGNGAAALLQLVCTRNVGDQAPGVSRYSHVCREDGGILDDVIVSRYEGHWLVVCNASNREKILNWLQRHAEGKQVEIVDQTIDTAMLAIQGPRTVELAERMLPLDLKSLKRYHFVTGNYIGMTYSIFRSGYTGEDGFEIIIPAGMAKLVASELFASSERAQKGEIKPAGLGARDTLRMEAAMPLYGHELTEQVDSLSAGLGWCVDLSKEFVGADALRRLKAQGLPRKLVGLELEGRRIARQSAGVFAGDAPVGAVTSGTLSPTLGKSIAMAYVASAHAAEGGTLSVEIAGTKTTAQVVKLPFYKRK
jgi:aminomethyltransferase